MLTGHTPFGFKWKPPTFEEKIYERYHIRNQNVNICFTGENKTGKSYGGLKYGNDFAKKVTHSKLYVVFTYEEFFELAQDENINNVVILFDEVGSESRTDRFWEAESQNFGEILELWGMKKCILISTLVNWFKLTSGAKGMVHYRCNCMIQTHFGKGIYLVQPARKWESFKRGREIFVPFGRPILMVRDEETDKLYEDYYPKKISNYNDKLKEMEERYKRSHRIRDEVEYVMPSKEIGEEKKWQGEVP